MVLVLCALIPYIFCRPGSFEINPATGKLDRGTMVPLACTRAQRAHSIAQACSVATRLAYCRPMGVLLCSLIADSPLMELLTMQTLGSTVQTLKVVLFAQLMAVFGNGEGTSAILQVVLLLALTVLYWGYMRAFVPLAAFGDMLSEV